MTSPKASTVQAPFINDSDFVLHVGDSREVIRELPNESVDCVVTSPPFYALRDYGTGDWEEGDPACDHLRAVGGAGRSTLWTGSDSASRFSQETQRTPYRGNCGKCGAVRVDRQIGLEDSLDEYVATLVSLFREVWRILAPHGTVWLNLGDSYASLPGGGRDQGGGQGASSQRKGRRNVAAQVVDSKRGGNGAGTNVRPPGVPGIKPKDLMGVPWAVAFALRADGWYLRMDNIWSKPNAMPESIADRPTKAHEFVFMLSKSGAPTYWTHELDDRLVAEKPKPDYWWFPPEDVAGDPSQEPVAGWKRRNVWNGRDYFFDQEASREPYASEGQLAITQATLDASLPPEAARGPDGRRVTRVEGRDGSLQHRSGERWPSSGRNMRSVWEIVTTSYAGAHFAVYPEELVERCLIAGCPELVCTVCARPRHGVSDCGHASYRPGIVFDPFMGSGTTALVARRHGRHAVGVELNPKYAALCAERTAQLALPLAAAV
jgi:site-specific DNA-methyltransferase (cytosine-N4-specific)